MEFGFRTRLRLRLRRGKHAECGNEPKEIKEYDFEFSRLNKLCHEKQKNF